MKNLVIAVALFGFAIFLAKSGNLPSLSGSLNTEMTTVSGEGTMESSSLNLPQINDFDDFPQIGVGTMVSQMDAIAEHLDTNPLMTSGLIVKATEACLPENAPDMVIASLSRFVRVLSENTLLPEADREADVVAQMLILGQEFETQAATLSLEDQEKAALILTEHMKDPMTLFNCNAGWLRSLN